MRIMRKLPQYLQLLVSSPVFNGHLLVHKRQIYLSLEYYHLVVSICFLVFICLSFLNSKLIFWLSESTDCDWKWCLSKGQYKIKLSISVISRLHWYSDIELGYIEHHWSLQLFLCFSNLSSLYTASQFPPNNILSCSTLCFIKRIISKTGLLPIHTVKELCIPSTGLSRYFG